MRAARQLRGLFDDLQAVTEEMVNDDPSLSVSDECIASASQSMASFDANINDVQDNWKPTNFYTIEQTQQIVGFGLEAVSQAQNLIATGVAALQLPNHRKLLEEAHEELSSNSAINATDFINAINNAKRQAQTTGKNVIIESSGLKRWVVNVLKACRRARFVSSAVSCARPGMLLGAIARLDAAAQMLINFVKTMAVVVKTAVDVVLKIPDLLGTVFKVLSILPWFVVAGAGYYVATKTVLPPKYDPLKLRDRDTFKPWRKKPGLQGLKKLSVPGGRY